jgi:methionine-rich copper-binding protein CopC
MTSARHHTLQPLRRSSALATAFALALATAASAHTEVTATSPASGGTARTTLARVTVTFTGAVTRGTLRVVGPGGKVASLGTGGRDPRNTSRLLVGLKGSLKPGAYRARWTAVAPDGHKQRGSFGFRLRR